MLSGVLATKIYSYEAVSSIWMCATMIDTTAVVSAAAITDDVAQQH